MPRILELGFEKAPEEACGIIVPDMSKHVDDWVVQLKNRHPRPADAYLIDAATVLSLVEAKEVWDDVVIWHTHPGGHIGPSREDLASALPDLRYLVVSLPGGEMRTFGAW